MHLLLPDQLLRIRTEPLDGFTDDEFFEFCQLNSDMRIERSADKEITVMPPVGGDSGAASFDVLVQLGSWNRVHAGRPFESSIGFVLPDGAMLSPDASWVRREVWAAILPADRKKFLRVCPDFIIEVKSPSDRPNVLQAKMEQWLSNGVRLAFMIDPETETAHIYRPGQEPEIVQGFDNELSGEPVLPGFRLDLRELRAQS